MSSSLPNVFGRAYVISRSVKDVSRHSAFHASARQAGLHVETFEAIDKDDLVFGSSYTERLIMDGYITRDRINRPGTLACALSHFNIWHRVMVENSTEPTLIFEDDTQFPPGFLPILSTFFAHLQPPWDMALLNHNNLEGSPVGRAWIRAKPLTLEHMGGINGMQNAYLVNVRGARRMLHAVLPFNASAPLSKDNLMKLHYQRDIDAVFLRCCLATQSHSKSVRSDGEAKGLVDLMYKAHTHGRTLLPTATSAFNASASQRQKLYAEKTCAQSSPCTSCEALLSELPRL